MPAAKQETSLEARLPDRAADEKGAEPVEVERGLLGFAHRLHDGREREQLLADETDDEVVVVAIEAVTGQTDVVRVIAGTEGHPDRAVLREDRALLRLGKLREA